MLLLPNELIGKICNEVDRLEDKKSLRKTCTRLGRALRPHLLANVTINIHKHNLKPGLDLLHALVHQKELCSPHIRTLHINSLSPSFFPDPDFEEKRDSAQHTWELYEMVRGWVSDPEDDKNREIMKAHAALNSLLDPALRSLHNLETFRWHWHWKDAEWTLQTIMQSLSSLSRIKEFSLSYTPHSSQREVMWRNPFIPLPELFNLQVLSLSILSEKTRSSRSNTTPAPVILPLMDHLLSRTSSLSGLHLDTGISSDASCPNFPLDDIAPQLQYSITHLSIGGWSVDILPEIPTEFPNLSSLSIRIGRRSGHRLRTLFEGLIFHQIHLRCLVSDKFTDPMLDYIASYSGLEVLSFTGPNWYGDRPEYNRTADRFYSDILPLHQDTLVKLEVLPAFEGKWCLGEDNLAAIAGCSKLRYLGIRIRSDGIYIDPDFDMFAHFEFSMPNLVHQLFDMVNTSLPDLQTLHIDSAHFGNSASRSRSGTKYCRGVRKGIHKSIDAAFSDDRQEYCRGVLKWAKVYVAGERLTMSHVNMGEIPMRKSKGSLFKMMKAKMSWRRSVRVQN
ncbi:hypothetical protein VKT23_006006 [Stygiomarasmius scandens]|uniref:F-box domain-containing protein n=1 Tax=Marasmiellus scandens TaxID=2682957 RepID=A0ABR1JQD7_9AGAR